MTGRSRKRIYVFEKEAEFRTMLETSLTLNEAMIGGFSGHQECIERLATKPCDLLILDLEGCEPEGLDVLEQVRRVAPWIPSLAIVEHAAVCCAIKAIKAGAGDCLDKPVEKDRLLSAVTTQLARVDTSTRRRPRALTHMEVQILQMILAGKTSYDMADELHRSKRTVDVHRKNIMRKLQATGLVDLIKRALGMGFADYPEQMQDQHKQDEDGHGPADERPTGQQNSMPGTL
jgi:FixJ family two-component response regulator